MYVYVYVYISLPGAVVSQPAETTKGPMWGYPRLVLGALGSFLEPFCGHVLPKVEKLCSKLTFEIPPRRALRESGPRFVDRSQVD